MDVFEMFKNHILKEEYFEAHEVLEDLWQKIRKTDHPEKNAYRGLINSAVSLELKKRGRDKSRYMSVWATFEKYKKEYKKNPKLYELYLFMKELKPL